eukprot:TRINITY_DN24251_c0_g5_i1.p3 TRINITY_DN24251_c0_g5~~TRINITY_DN24251_c0_g5_i1.p3  ORF type:complete len:112 (-),score=3.73 TRINITY_DN24251_c0_g5_i1:544-879(-)
MADVRRGNMFKLRGSRCGRKLRNSSILPFTSLIHNNSLSVFRRQNKSVTKVRNKRNLRRCIIILILMEKILIFQKHHIERNPDAVYLGIITKKSFMVICISQKGTLGGMSG